MTPPISQQQVGWRRRGYRCDWTIAQFCLNPSGRLVRLAPMIRTEAGVSTTTPTGLRIAGLDGLRAFAVLTVFVGHAGLHSYLPFLPGAGTGVTIFFFLSGYLITSLLRREFSQAGG